MKKTLLLIVLFFIPSFVFAGNNNSLKWPSQDIIISMDRACSMKYSDGWNEKESTYEQLEFTGSSVYNSVYGFKKQWHILYFVQVWWSQWESNSLVYTPDNAHLISYHCVSRKLQKLASWNRSIYHINNIQRINRNYIVILNAAPEANVIYYTVINKKTWRVYFLHTLENLK